MLPHNCHVLTYINIYVYNKCVKFILLLKHTLKNKHLIITLKKKKSFPITRDINKENKKVHNSHSMYIKGEEKKKTTKALKTTLFWCFSWFHENDVVLSIFELDNAVFVFLQDAFIFNSLSHTVVLSHTMLSDLLLTFSLPRPLNPINSLKIGRFCFPHNLQLRFSDQTEAQACPLRLFVPSTIMGFTAFPLPQFHNLLSLQFSI